MHTFALNDMLFYAASILLGGYDVINIFPDLSIFSLSLSFGL